MPLKTQNRRSVKRENLLARLGKQLGEADARLRLAHEQGAGGFETARARANTVTEVLRKAYAACFRRTASFPDNEFALVATGGFGRRLLEPWSDIDLILMQTEEPHELTADTLRALDDFAGLLGGLRLSTGPLRIMSVAELWEPALQEFSTMTALLDVFLVAGDRDFFITEISESVRPSADMAVDNLSELLSAILERNQDHGFLGSSPSPHIKLCSGGLRDFHSLHWFARFLGLDDFRDLVSEGILTEDEAAAAGKAADFLMRVRTALHYRHRSATARDVLSPEDRRAMAPLFENGGAHHAALNDGERFSAGLHRHAAGLMRATLAACSRFFARHNLPRTETGDAGEPIEDDSVPF